MNPLSMAKDILMPSKAGLSVELETVIGDKQETINTQIGNKSNTKQEAETINNQTINETDYVMLFLLVLGWVLPTPSNMWKGLTAMWSRKRDG